MVSVVGICNSALLKIGSERISSLTETSKRALICNEQYEKLRDEVLSAHPWNFATARLALAALPTPPAFGFDYQYALPTDCLRVLQMSDPNEAFKIESGVLLTDSDTVSIVYVKQVTDPTFYSATFTEALSYRLAKDLAFALAQNNALSQTMAQEYERQIRLARSMDAQEGTPDEFMADDWLNSRW